MGKYLRMGCFLKDIWVYHLFVVTGKVFCALAFGCFSYISYRACFKSRMSFNSIFLSRSEELMVPTLSKKEAASFVQSASTDPFTIEWYMKMTDNADLNKDLESRFTLKDPRFHDTPTLIDFAVVFETFYKQHRVWLIYLVITYYNYHLINQSILQSINQFINQSINQSINQLVNRSIDRSINHSINQSVSQSASQSGNRSTGHSVDRLSDRYILLLCLVPLFCFPLKQLTVSLSHSPLNKNLFLRFITFWCI